MSHRVAATLLLAISTSAWASLWELTRDSSVVVLARVEQPGAVTAKGRSVARLRVKETWKGGPVSTLEVRFSPDVACPNPPSYRVGEDVIAFLTPGTDPDTWVTVASAEGARYARSDSELAAIKAAVLHATSLPAEAKTQWALQAFESPSTRHDAALVLGGVANPLAWRTIGGPAPVVLPKTTLAALEASFIRNPTQDNTLISSMVLLRTQRTQQLNAAFANSINTITNTANPPDWLPVAVSLYEERLHPLRPIARTLSPEAMLEEWSRRRTPEAVERARQRWRALRQ